MKKKPFVVQHTFYILLCSVEEISLYETQMLYASLKVQDGHVSEFKKYKLKINTLYRIKSRHLNSKTFIQLKLLTLITTYFIMIN